MKRKENYLTIILYYTRNHRLVFLEGHFPLRSFRDQSKCDGYVYPKKK